MRLVTKVSSLNKRTSDHLKQVIFQDKDKAFADFVKASLEHYEAELEDAQTLLLFNETARPTALMAYGVIGFLKELERFVGRE